MYAFVNYRTADYMTKQPVTVLPETPLADVQATFESHGFNGLPVVDSNRHLLGVATKMDILRAFTLQPEHIVPPYHAIMKQPVGSVMNRAVMAVSPDLPLTRVLQKLVDMGVKSLPVVEGETLVGVIAREDVLQALRDATRG